MLPCCAAKLQPGQKKHLTITETANPHSLTIPLTPRSAGTTFPGGGCQRLAAVTRRAFSAPASTLPLCRSPTPSLARTLQYATHSPPRIFCRDDGTQIFGCVALSLNEATMAVSHSARNARTTSLHHWPLVLIHRATSDRNLKPRRLRKSTR